MRFLVITEPQFTNNEAAIIAQLLHWGVDLVHLRKPESSAEELAKLIEAIPTAYHNGLVLHDHFDLAAHFALHGLHLNRRNSVLPPNHKGTVSQSCHTLDEVKVCKTKCDYVFLSPVFNSISKQGYTSAFTPKALSEAKKQGVINQKVVALGGITAANIDKTKYYGFGGVALLGDIWSRTADKNFEEYVRKIIEICHT
ncbi:thiamine phosphate synthase [Prevotella intermedia]|uniref:Thiamine phosphate synthase n=1 Tax=Prevotella intermedia TaxID=28131 RepID=A0A2M8M8X1_PREIN|nr:thiamine phosphate synthase [Prevotella intermedia]PJF00650.1 thiamine phosphate synthase [Prevotella intermedia]